MRASGQLAVIAVLGGAGFGGWYAWKEGHLAKVPVVGSYLPAPRRVAPPAPARAGRGAPQAPATVEVDTVRTGRVVEIREAVGTVRAFESITVTAKVPGVVQRDRLRRRPESSRPATCWSGSTPTSASAEIEHGRRRDQPGRRAARRAQHPARARRRAAPLRRRHGGAGGGPDRPGEGPGRAPSPPPRPGAGRPRRGSRTSPSAPPSAAASAPAPSRSAPTCRPDPHHHARRPLKVRLDFAVPENLLDQLKPGQVVRARPRPSGAAVRGQGRIIDPRIEPTTRSVRLTAEFENKDEALQARHVPVGGHRGLEQGERGRGAGGGGGQRGPAAHRLPVKDGKIERRVIRIGQRQGGKVEVVEG